MQADLAGVYAREEIAAEHKSNHARKHAEREETRGEKAGMFEHVLERALIAFAESLKGAFKSLLKAAKKALPFAHMVFGVIFVLCAQQVHGHGRNDGAGPHIGGEHGEADGFGERDEQKSCNTREEEHWDENDADAESGNERGHGDLLGAIQNGLNGVLAHGEVAVDVFDFDGGVVHENADGEGEAAEGHDVDGFAERAEEKNADENRKRNRNENNERALPVSEEEQNHNDCETRGDQALAQDALNGSAHKERLVKELIDLHASRILALVVLEHGLDAIDDVERGCVAGFVDAHEHATLAVCENNVGLWRKTVAYVGDFAHVRCGAVHGFYRQIVQFVHALRTTVHFDGVFERTHFGRAGGQDQVLRGDRIDNVHGGKAVRLKGGGIRIHRDEALFSAVRKGSGGALNRGELCADEVVAEVKELLFAESIAREAKLNDGNGGRRINNDQRRGCPGRQKTQKRLRNGGGLRERRLNIRVRLEKDLDDGNAGKRLRLCMLDVVDKRGDAALNVARDAQFHFLRLKTVVGPDQADDGNIDRRKNVRGRAHEHHRGQENDDERHHDKRVGPLKR